LKPIVCQSLHLRKPAFDANLEKGALEFQYKLIIDSLLLSI